MRVGKCIPTLEEMQCMGGHSLLVISCQLAVDWLTTIIIIIIIIASLGPKCWLTVYVQRKGFPVKFFGLSVIRINYNHTLFSIFKWKGINFWKTPYIQNYTFWLTFVLNVGTHMDNQSKAKSLSVLQWNGVDGLMNVKQQW